MIAVKRLHPKTKSHTGPFAGWTVVRVWHDGVKLVNEHLASPAAVLQMWRETRQEKEPFFFIKSERRVGK